MNANPTVRTDSNTELVWPKPVPEPVDPNQLVDFHPAVLLIWWAKQEKLAKKWWSVMSNIALKPCYHLSMTKAYILQ